MVIVYVAINATGFAIRVSDAAAPWAAPPLGLLSGLLTGTTGYVGIPIALYLQARGLDKDSFLRAIALTFLISASMLVIALLEKGALGRTRSGVCGQLIPFAGMAIGQRLHRLSEDLFEICISVSDGRCGEPYPQGVFVRIRPAAPRLNARISKLYLKLTIFYLPVLGVAHCFRGNRVCSYWKAYAVPSVPIMAAYTHATSIRCDYDDPGARRGRDECVDRQIADDIHPLLLPFSGIPLASAY